MTPMRRNLNEFSIYWEEGAGCPAKCLKCEINVVCDVERCNVSLIEENTKHKTHTQAERVTEQHDPHKLVSVDTNKS